MAGRVKHRGTRAVTYRRKSDPIKPRKQPVEIDSDELEAMRNPRVNGTKLSPKGTCYDCGRPVTGERRFCGGCLAKH